MKLDIALTQPRNHSTERPKPSQLAHLTVKHASCKTTMLTLRINQGVITSTYHSTAQQNMSFTSFNANIAILFMWVKPGAN
jgi:hypothetical protein